MGIVQNVIGMVHDINDRRKAAQIDDALRKNYMTDPNAAFDQITQIDPVTGIKMRQDYQANQLAISDAARKRAEDNAVFIGRSLRGVTDPSKVGEAIDGMTPYFTGLGIGPDQVGNFKAAVTANPSLLTSMDDDAWKAMVKDRFTTTVLTPGSVAMRNGQPIARAGYAQKAVTTRGGDGAARTDAFDPNTGTFNKPVDLNAGIPGQGGTAAPTQPGMAMPGRTPATGGSAAPGAPMAMSVESLRPHFVAQESHGDYTAHNTDTGALGAYQIMPATGRTLAQRLGLAWRPDMMQKDDPASRRYQDAIGGAAIKEAIQASGGDPAAAFAYYHGGSDRSLWGPKTAAYVADMEARTGMRGGGASPAPAQLGGQSGGAPVTMPGRPVKRVRAATPQELAAAGYPEGTAGQVDETGKFVNLKTPPAGSKGKVNPADRLWTLYDEMDKMERFATDALNSPGLDTATGSIAGHIPTAILGQDATDFNNKLEALRGNVRIGEIMKLKAQSPTGSSGLANISNEEGRSLEQGFGSLNRTSASPMMRGTLQNIVNTARTIKSRAARQLQESGEWAKRYGTGGASGAAAPPPPIGTIVRVGNTRKQYTANGWVDYKGGK